MNKTLKKIIFWILATSWINGIIADVLINSATSNIWGTFNAIWLLVLLSAITIALTLYAAISYIFNNKDEAYKSLMLAILVYIIVGLVELFFANMINKETLTQWFTVGFNERRETFFLPFAVKYTTLWYIQGQLIYGIVWYFVFLRWKKIKQRTGITFVISIKNNLHKKFDKLFKN